MQPPTILRTRRSRRENDQVDGKRLTETTILLPSFSYCLASFLASFRAQLVTAQRLDV